MNIQLKVSVRIFGKSKDIIFGLPNSNGELNEMFQFRYKNYLRHNYIEPNHIEKDIDEYDSSNKCFYFIAKIDNRVIGCVRLIKDYYLPTETKCFKFSEPLEIKKIAREKRAEISRLIVEGYGKNIFLPRHLIMLGLIYLIVEFGKDHELLAGYSFIKESLRVKLDRLKFPYHEIENFIQIYNGQTLKKYFSDSKNSVIPIYYFFYEVEEHINRIFNNRLLFKKQNNRDYIFRTFFLWNLYRKFLWR